MAITDFLDDSEGVIEDFFLHAKMELTRGSYNEDTSILIDLRDVSAIIILAPKRARLLLSSGHKIDIHDLPKMEKHDNYLLKKWALARSQLNVF